MSSSCRVRSGDQVPQLADGDREGREVERSRRSDAGEHRLEAVDLGSVPVDPRVDEHVRGFAVAAQPQHLCGQLALLGEQVVAKGGPRQRLPFVVTHEIEHALAHPVDAEPVGQREEDRGRVGD